MINKLLITLIAFMILILGVSGCVDNSKSLTNASDLIVQNTSDKVNASVANVKIAPEEAKEISKKYINQSGATPGEPLLKADGNKVYIVPIMVNGNPTGQIIIDAQTGELKGSLG